MPVGTAGRWVLAVAGVAALALFGCGKKTGQWERYDLDLHKTILSIELPAKPSKREELAGAPGVFERTQRYSVEAQETQGPLYNVSAGNMVEKMMHDIETTGGVESFYDMLGGMLMGRVVGKPLGNAAATVGNGIAARELMFETDNRLRVITIRFFIDRGVIYFLEENRPRGKPQPDATARFFDSVQLK